MKLAVIKDTESPATFGPCFKEVPKEALEFANNFFCVTDEGQEDYTLHWLTKRVDPVELKEHMDYIQEDLAARGIRINRKQAKAMAMAELWPDATSKDTQAKLRYDNDSRELVILSKHKKVLSAFDLGNQGVQDLCHLWKLGGEPTDKIVIEVADTWKRVFSGDNTLEDIQPSLEDGRITKFSNGNFDGASVSCEILENTLIISGKFDTLEVGLEMFSSLKGMLDGNRDN